MDEHLVVRHVPMEPDADDAVSLYMKQKKWLAKDASGTSDASHVTIVTSRSTQPIYATQTVTSTAVDAMDVHLDQKVLDLAWALVAYQWFNTTPFPKAKFVKSTPGRTSVSKTSSNR